MIYTYIYIQKCIAAIKSQNPILLKSLSKKLVVETWNHRPLSMMNPPICLLLLFLFSSQYIYVYIYTVDGSAIKLARAVRQSFCNMCSKYNFTQIRYPQSSVFCRFCTQKMCIHHLQDLTTQTLETEDNIRGYPSRERQKLCCKGCRNPDLNNTEVLFVYLSLM